MFLTFIFSYMGMIIKFSVIVGAVGIEPTSSRGPHEIYH